MNTAATVARKRPVNLTLSEALVVQAKQFTNNLSATTESLLTEFVAAQQKTHAMRQQAADVCAQDWNTVHATLGSFADEHTTL